MDKKTRVRLALSLWRGSLTRSSTSIQRAKDLAPSHILAKVKTVGEKLGGEDTSFVPVDPKTVITLGDPSSNTVTDGKW